jgi:hypothetical protein
MLYSSDQPSAVVTPELVDAVVRLGGPSFPARTPRREQERRNSWDSDPRPDPLELQKRLANEQRPLLPDGRAGVVVAARDYELNKYRNDGAAPRWDLDALTNAIGWRIIETTINGGAEAGIELIDDVAREVSTFSDNEVFATVGEGLAIRCDDTMPDPLKRVAAYCLTRAYIRIRDGGWRTFAGRERANLWATAHALDAATAEQVLAEAIVGTVDTNAQSTYGVTQAVIAAFKATLPGTLGATAAECWEAAFRILDDRLPGVPQRREHTYRPTPTPDAPEVVDVAMATLAVATIAHPMRAELRQTLVATALLLTCRPTIGQAALAHVLGARIDAGRVAWLLDVVRACLRPGELSDELAAVLTRLAGSDWLSVRALAAVTLKVHGRPVPALPVTEPLPKVRAAFHDLMREHG